MNSLLFGLSSPSLGFAYPIQFGHFPHIRSISVTVFYLIDKRFHLCECSVPEVQGHINLIERPCLISIVSKWIGNRFHMDKLRTLGCKDIYQSCSSLFKFLAGWFFIIAWQLWICFHCTSFTDCSIFRHTPKYSRALDLENRSNYSQTLCQILQASKPKRELASRLVDIAGLQIYRETDDAW